MSDSITNNNDLVVRTRQCHAGAMASCRRLFERARAARPHSSSQAADQRSTSAKHIASFGLSAEEANW